MSQELLLNPDGPIARITFNRPHKANAFDPAWSDPMLQFFEEVARDPAVRCVLIRSTGAHFSAGGDVGAVDQLIGMEPVQRAAESSKFIPPYNRMIEAMHDCGKPVVAAVQGGVAGASVGFVAACDLVMCADDAFFFLAHAKLAATIDGLATYLLPRQIGERRTMELALLSDRIDARRAESWGLVNFVVPKADLSKEAEALAERLAAGPTRTLGLIRDLVRAGGRNGMHEQARLEVDTYARSAMTEDWKEGLVSFRERRPSRFAGR